jgi:hypothetical protein
MSWLNSTPLNGGFTGSPVPITGNHFVLKGALMLLAWEMPFSRPTRDIDLLGRVSNDLDLVRNAIAAICRIPTDEDGMVFDHEIGRD